MCLTLKHIYTSHQIGETRLCETELEHGEVVSLTFGVFSENQEWEGWLSCQVSRAARGDGTAAIS